MVNNVISITDSPAITNTKGVMLMRYAKPCSQLCIIHHDTGNAINKEMPTSFKKSFDNIVVMLVTDAPTTFLIPISFLLFCAVKAAKPNKPRQEIIMAKPAKYFDNADTLVSVSYCC